MFQDMMDRIEDETIKFLFFMRIDMGGMTSGTVVCRFPTLNWTTLGMERQQRTKIPRNGRPE